MLYKVARSGKASVDSRLASFPERKRRCGSAGTALQLLNTLKYRKNDVPLCQLVDVSLALEETSFAKARGADLLHNNDSQ
jgi:hypothetical protein